MIIFHDLESLLLIVALKESIKKRNNSMLMWCTSSFYILKYSKTLLFFTSAPRKRCSRKYLLFNPNTFVVCCLIEFV